MIGFYFKINQDTKQRIKLILTRYESLLALSSIEENCLYLFDDSNATKMVQSKNVTIYSIGTFIYNKCWGNCALELFAHDLESGKELAEIIITARGQFCLLIHYERKVILITDKTGSFPIYIFENNQVIQISNIFLLIAKFNPVSFDFQGLAEFVSNMDYCLGCTLFKEIKLLNDATIYQFGERYVLYRYYNLFNELRFGRYTDLREVSELTKKLLTENLSFLKSEDRIFSDITGGFDTRVIATILEKNSINFAGGICGEQVKNELKIAKEVARELKVKLYEDYRIRDIDQFNLTVSDHFNISNGVPLLYHSSELINYYKKIKEHFDIHITGFGGTELLTQSFRNSALYSSEINTKNIFVQYFGFLDIFKDKYITKNLYYNFLDKKIKSILQKAPSSNIRNIANYLKFSSYSRYYHGSIIAAHNCILPHYSPYLEDNIVRLSLETDYELKADHNIQKVILTQTNPSVSSIITSRGYSAYGSIQKIEEDRKTKSIKIFLKIFLLKKINKYAYLRKIKDIILKYMTVSKVVPPIEDSNRLFWSQAVKTKFSEEMRIFYIIDKKKFNGTLNNREDRNKLLSKIAYLDKLMNDYNPQF